MYRADLSADEDGKVKYVGWLDAEHEFPRFDTSQQEARYEKYDLVTALRQLTPTALTRGFHRCDLCGPKDKAALSSCELHVEYDGVIYIAPEMIEHYVNQHDYRPPAEYRLAIVKGSDAGKRL